MSNVCFRCRLFHLRGDEGDIIWAVSGPQKSKLDLLKFDLVTKEFKLVGSMNSKLRYVGAPFIDIPIKILVNEDMQNCNHLIPD